MPRQHEPGTLRPGAAIDTAWWRTRNSSTRTRTAVLTVAVFVAACVLFGPRAATFAAAVIVAAVIAAVAVHVPTRRFIIGQLATVRTSASVRYHWAWAMRQADMQQPTRFTYRWWTGRLERIPRVRSVHVDGPRLTVRGELLRGQGQLMWNRALDEVGNALERSRPRLTLDHKKRTVTLVFAGGVDVRIPQYDLTEPNPKPNLKAIPIARNLDGTDYTIHILGQHLLVAGETGSGKGSVLWSIMSRIAPARAAGIVRTIGLDGKGGVELWMGGDLFDAIYSGDDEDKGRPWQEDMCEALEDAVRDMRGRQMRLRGKSRLLEPSTSEPLVVIVIDEFLSLTVGLADPQLKKRINAAISTLLSQGRAVGYVVIACAQITQKEAIGSEIRDLFPRRICLRVSDAEQAEMVLGRGVRAKGGEADLIPEQDKGVAYVMAEGKMPVMVRFPWTSDERLKELEARYGKPHETRIGDDDEDDDGPDTAVLPAVNATETPAIEPPQPVAKSKAEALRDAIDDARSRGADPTPDWLAQTVGCTRRYARQILAQAQVGV